MVTTAVKLRRLLLGRKVIPNLGSKDITLPAKVHLVVTMVFPVIMYGCESWTNKEDWVLTSWCFRTVVLEKTLESLLDCKISQSLLKEISPEYSASPDVKIQLNRKYLDVRKDRRQWEKGTTEDKMVGWHHWLNEHGFEQAPGDCEGQGSLVYCSLWGHKELDMIEWLNHNNPTAPEFRNSHWIFLIPWPLSFLTQKESAFLC